MRFKTRPLQISQPALNQLPRRDKIQVLVFAGIFFKIGRRQSEQRGGGTRVIPLQMHKRAGELNQAFVKRAVRTVLVLQPDVFEHLMRLVKKLAVETVKIADVMLIQFVSLMLFHQCGDAFVFAAHGFRVRAG